MPPGDSVGLRPCLLLLCHGNVPRPIASHRLRTIKAVVASVPRGASPNPEKTPSSFSFFFSLFFPSSPARPSGRASSRASLAAALLLPSAAQQTAQRQRPLPRLPQHCTHVFFSVLHITRQSQVGRSPTGTVIIAAVRWIFPNAAQCPVVPKSEVSSRQTDASDA